MIIRLNKFQMLIKSKSITFVTDLNSKKIIIIENYYLTHVFKYSIKRENEFPEYTKHNIFEIFERF